MPVTLNGLNATPRSDTLNALSGSGFGAIATIGAGVSSTTVQAYELLPFQFKIRKVSVQYNAIDNVAGTDSFNIVIGPGAYTQNNPAPNDNSFDPSSLTTVGVGLPFTGAAPVLGGVGYPTNVGVALQTVFATDVPFGPLAGTYGTAGVGSGVSTTGTGWITLTTTGGYGIFVPTNYDAVYPENIPLTLRVTTVASTGSITSLNVRIAITPVRKRPAPPGAEAVAPLPSIDY